MGPSNSIAQSSDVRNARYFLDIAMQDLVAAKVLYRKKLYPEALFFLQQSIEKGYKTFHLLSEIGNESEDLMLGNLSTKKIGHKPTKITERIASRAEQRILSVKKNIELFPDPKAIYSVIGTDFSRLLLDLSESKKKYSQLSTNTEICQKIDNKNLDNMLRELFQLLRRSNEFHRIIKSITFDETTKQQSQKEYERIFVPVFRQIPGYSENQVEEFSKLFGEEFEEFEPMYKSLMEIFIESGIVNAFYAQLSVITQAHESSTRYPEYGRSPLLKYTQRHPIIRRFNTICWFTGTAHLKMDNFVKNAME